MRARLREIVEVLVLKAPVNHKAFEYTSFAWFLAASWWAIDKDERLLKKSETQINNL